jgi:putative Ca2+/H+ antiporter (TMEM165/GDT1 family)
MSISEQMWFLVGISGFVLFMEGAIIYILKRFNRRIPDELARAGAGLLLFIIALVCLLNLPR